MPHIDELLGIATFAAAGLAVAVAIQPVAGHNAAADSHAAAAAAREAQPVTHVQTIEVVARRGTATPDSNRRSRSIS
jgi:hypothetical protein